MSRTIGFLSGLGAGMGLGLLLAPRSGDRTRELIRRRASKGADYLWRQSNYARNAAAEAIHESNQRITKEADALRAAVDAGRKAYSQSIRS